MPQNPDKVLEALDHFQQRQQEQATSGRGLEQLCNDLLAGAVLDKGDPKDALQDVIVKAVADVQMDAESVVINDVQVDVRQ